MKAATDLDRWRNPPIQRLLGTATVLAGNHQNKVWRGITQVPGNVEAGIPTVIKWIEKKEVVATELACSFAYSSDVDQSIQQRDQLVQSL